MKISKRIKYQALRRFLKWRNNNKFKTIIKLDNIQQKSSDLFKLYLKNPEADLCCSLMSGKRHIEIENVLLILNNTTRGYILTVIDENQNNSINCYEVNLPEQTAHELINLFDHKMERRLVQSESSKKETIAKDLDSLIEEATKTIKQPC